MIGPPPVLRLAALLDVPPRKKPKKAVPAASLELAASSGLPSSSCTTLVADAVQLEIPGTRARPLVPDAALQPPPCLEGLQLVPSMQVYCSAEAVAKHPRTAAYLLRKGCLTTKPAEATHKVCGSKAEKAMLMTSSVIGSGWLSMSNLLQELRAHSEGVTA